MHGKAVVLHRSSIWQSKVVWVIILICRQQGSY